MGRPVVRRTASRSNVRVETRKTPSRAQSHNKVILTADEARLRIKELCVIEQRQRVIEGELKTYVRETGLSLQAYDHWVDYRRSIYPETPVHALCARAWFYLMLQSEGIDLEHMDAGTQHIYELGVELLASACASIQIRSWPKFLFETGLKEDILSKIAEWDEQEAERIAMACEKRGEEPPQRMSYAGLYTHYGDATLDIRKSDTDDEKSEQISAQAIKEQKAQLKSQRASFRKMEDRGELDPDK